MTLTFVALRSALFAGGFLWLWTWVALLLRPFDDVLGGPLPEWSRAAGIMVLAFGEIVWGDGNQTFTRTFDLSETRPFGSGTFEWKTEARNWQWARVSVWDVAGNGAFINPVRR